MTSTIKPTEKKKRREKSLVIWTRCDVLLQHIINAPDDQKKHVIKTVVEILHRDYGECFPTFRERFMIHLKLYLEEDFIDKELYEYIKKKMEE